MHRIQFKHRPIQFECRMRYTFSVASLRWHYPDQVQGFFSPGKCGTHLPRTPSFLLLQQVNQTTSRVYAITAHSQLTRVKFLHLT